MSHRQQGVALIGLLALLTLGASWWLVSAITAPANRTALDREHNARVLGQAKQALIGKVGTMVLETPLDDNPGRLPCPEAPGSANNFAAGEYVVSDDGIAAGNCALPAVGRLPWRTLGIDKLVDASGEPLWYVVSPGWALSNATVPPLETTINSNSAGQLSLDGSGDIVALIIAPGRALDVQAGGGCAARTQTRTRQANVNWDARDFIECANSDGNAAFASSGPRDSFNDQVLAVTSGDVLPVIESAVATRFVQQMGSSMRYCGGVWPTCNAAVKYPFAATFGDPSAASYQGVVNLRQGLLPLSFSGAGGCVAAGSYCNPPAPCDPALDNRCAPTLVTYRGNPTITQTASGDASVALQNYSCAAAGTPSTLTCTLNIQHGVLVPAGSRWIEFDLDLTSNNVGLALRDINAQVQVTGVQTAGMGTINSPYGYSVTSAALNADASATVRIRSRVEGASGGLVLDLACGLLGWLLELLYDCNAHAITVPFMWVDEPMLYADNATMEWWYRNGWHELAYYAVSQDNAPSGDGTCAGASCLTVNGPTVTMNHRALLVMPGRALAGQDRSAPVALDTWLEVGNSAPADDDFWARGTAATMANRSFNDHIVAIGSNP
jgi:hypothetical protein